MRKKDFEYMADPDYIKSIQAITNNTEVFFSVQKREAVMDVLFELLDKYDLDDSTFHLAANLFDRFLSKVPIMPAQALAYGLVAFYVANKLLDDDKEKEDNVDNIFMEDLAEMCGTSDKTLRSLEFLLLRNLKFELMVPTAVDYIDEYARLILSPRTETGQIKTTRGGLNVDYDVASLGDIKTAKALCALAVYDYSMLRYSPSMVGAMCLYIAFYKQKRIRSLQRLAEISGYNGSDPTPEMQSCIGRIIQFKNSCDIGPKENFEALIATYRYNFEFLGFLVSPWIYPRQHNRNNKRKTPNVLNFVIEKNQSGSLFDIASAAVEMKKKQKIVDTFEETRRLQRLFKPDELKTIQGIKAL